MANEEFWKKRPEVLDAIMERRSIRKFADTPISDEDMEKILLAGHYAPNTGNAQPWEFIAVTNRELNNEIAGLIDETFRDMGHLLEDREAKKHVKYSRFYSKFFAAAPLGIFYIEKPYLSKSDHFYSMMGDAGETYINNRKMAGSALQSVAAAIQNMILAAWSMGIGSVWLTAPMVARDKIEAKLEVKEGHLVAIAAFGYPTDPLREPVRKPLEEVVKIIK